MDQFSSRRANSLVALIAIFACLALGLRAVNRLPAAAPARAAPAQSCDPDPDVRQLAVQRAGVLRGADAEILRARRLLADPRISPDQRWNAKRILALGERTRYLIVYGDLSEDGWTWGADRGSGQK